MHILVTGGTGFIGKALCLELLRQGHALTVLSRQAPGAVHRILGESLSAIGTGSLLPASERFDAIINLAGAPIAAKRWTDARKRELLDSRIGFTRQLIAFIAEAEYKPAVLISGSAVGYYGNQGDALLTESSTPVSDFSHRLCSEWETEALRAAEFGVRVCTLRTGLVVGRNGGFLSRLLPLFKLGLGGRLGDGRQWMSWIHLEDHVAMMIRLLNEPEWSGPFNATGPEPVTNGDFTDQLASILRRPALLPVPAFALRLVLGELSELLLGGQRALPARLQEYGFKFRFPSLEAALAGAVSRAP